MSTRFELSEDQKLARDNLVKKWTEKHPVPSASDDLGIIVTTHPMKPRQMEENMETKPIKAWCVEVDGELWVSYCHQVRRDTQEDAEANMLGEPYKIVRVIVTKVTPHKQGGGM